MFHIRTVRKTSMHRQLTIITIIALMLAVLTLVACVTLPAASPAPNVVIILGTPVETETFDQSTLIAALTQEQNNTDIQAAATAAIVQANAQATLDSADTTLSAAQTQAQNITNVIAAQIAYTAVFVRANARATLVAANSTQSAALTQDAIRQTQTEYGLQVTQAAGTQSAASILSHQYSDALAGGTQTAVANNIATQTQVAVVTSQWYASLNRQRQERMRVPITFLWTWCFPIFLLILAALVVWGFWRWLKIRQANQRILENPVEKLPAPTVSVRHHQREVPSPYLEGEEVDGRYQLTKPVDPVRRWVDEVKGKLLRSDKKDEDDNTDD
ncbi:MAG: hypothetical protein WCE68_03980 [Anaerolineales bacterium]